jgi:hypothetical protein
VIAPYDRLIDPVAIPALAGAVQAALTTSIAVMAAGLVIGAWSLVVRFRRARGVERQQLRWVAFAAALTVPLAGVVVAAVLLDATDAPAVVLAAGVGMALLPLAVGAAILRYRLYDLDRIISRTVAWTALTVVLALGYGAVVLLLSRLLPDSSTTAVAGATLAVAAVFQPARRRIQRLVDRRFNRHRYDAARTIQAFSGRLREQADLDTLSAELLAVVEETMQPTGVSLWLRPLPAAPASAARR